MAALDSRGKVLELRALPLQHFLLRIQVAGMEPAAPGQFVMVAGANQVEPYLRRAFSVYDQEPAGTGALTISLLGKVIGRGTAALAACLPGQDVPVLGPLGRGFHSMGANGPHGGRAALVAGGIGSAGLGLLAQALAREGKPFDFYYGGRSADDLVEAEEFQRLSESTGGRLLRTTEDGTAGGRRLGGGAAWAGPPGGRLLRTTEDGTAGARGLVTEALAATLEAGAAQAGSAYEALYTCGPHGLMAAVARIAVEHGIEGEAAMETPMGCGYGACLGCAVELEEGGYALCCRQGPVFNLREVAW